MRKRIRPKGRIAARQKNDASLCVIAVLTFDVVRFTSFLELDLARGDAVKNGADVEAEMATDAFVGDGGFARFGVEVDGLVPTVEAGNGATAASDAFVEIDFGDDLEGSVEIFAGDDVGEGFSDEVAQGGVSVGFHEIGESVLHVFDDAIAVLHDGSGDLEIFGAQEEEFDGILPCFDAADAGYGEVGEFGILLELCDEAEGDGLDGGAGVAGDGGFSVDDGLSGEVFDVDVADGFDGVDGGDGVRATAERALGGIFDVGDVGGHFGDDGEMGVLLDDAGVTLDEFGVHADVGAHGVARHLRT